MSKKGQNTERVHALVTFGAAKPGLSALTNEATGNKCVDGYRFVNQDLFSVDPVPALLGTFAHPYMISVKLHDDSTYKEFDCEDNRQTKIVFPKVSYHDSKEYLRRLVGSNLSKEIKSVARNGLIQSYEGDAEIVRSSLTDGWKLAGTAYENEDMVHLIQNQDAECILTFSGSNDASDWKTNGAFWGVDFCNLNTKVHNGFRSEVMRVVQTSQYLENIKPKLSSCSKVTALGHSLGGAMASIFMACANNEVDASDDENFTTLKWW